MRHLRIIPWSDDGGDGWKLKEVRPCKSMAIATTDGVVIAHDVLEHQNGLKHIGSIADEFEALGGVLYIRDALGWDWRQIRHDVENLWDHWCSGVPLRAEGTPRIPTGKNEFEDRILHIVVSKLRDYTLPEDSTVTKDMLFKWSSFLMKRGLYKAFRRFDHEGCVRTAGLFTAISKVCDRAFRDLDAYEAKSYGVELTLSYDFNIARVQPAPECRDPWLYPWADFYAEDRPGYWAGCTWEDLG